MLELNKIYKISFIHPSQYNLRLTSRHNFHLFDIPSLLCTRSLRNDVYLRLFFAAKHYQIKVASVPEWVGFAIAVHHLER